MLKFKLMASIALVSCLVACMKTTSSAQRTPPGSSYVTCEEGKEYCLRSMQEAASMRCLPVSECGPSTIYEGGACVQSAQCSDNLKCCTKGPMQAAEQLRCHPVDSCASGTIAP